MLCSRPNENQNAPVDKYNLVILRPFCGRVYNHEQVGLVPCRNERSPVR